jgi:hypothetical protein
MKKIVSLFFLLLVFTSFSQDLKKTKENFIKDFKALVGPFVLDDQKPFLNKQLEAIIMDPVNFSEVLTVDMISTYEILKSKKFKPYPVIYNYVYSVCAFNVYNKKDITNFVSWQQIIEVMIDKKNQARLQDFLDVSATFFTNRVLVENATFDWYYLGGTYRFENPEKPMIIFDGGKLVCYVKNTSADKDDNPNIDSLIVYQSSGIFDPTLKKWVGQGGIINWEKTGIAKNDTYAELTKYELSLKSSTLNCDTVTLKTFYFNQPIKGKLSDRAFRVNREEDKIYPQFISFEKRLEIKKIVENVDYEGGFSLMGKNFIGVGIGGSPARIVVERNKKEFIRLYSQRIAINKEKIVCNDGKSSIYIGTSDSIFHPNIEFTFDIKNQQIEFVRGSKGMAMAPFSNTYHQLDMYVPKLAWKYDAQEIMFTYLMGMGQDQRYARLESKQFFDGRLYDKLQGLQKNHPIASIADYCYRYDEYTMVEGKMATALSMTIEQAKTILLELATLGFINYDTENKIISVTPKLLTFARAKSGKIDYDNLSFESDFRPKKLSGYNDKDIEKDKNLIKIREEYEKNNKYREGLKNFGFLNIGTLEIKLEAVDMVNLSEAQKTVVFPTDGKVVIRENRNFDFAGWVNSGKLQVNTEEANYIYNTHKINLFKTNRSLLNVRPMQEADGKQSILVMNEIHGFTGEILVDDPKNRNGLSKTITDFPKLNISKPSTIFYNQKSIYQGAYDSTRFYFTLDPFKLDSLDNFHERSQRFAGELVSAGIFPKFREEIKIMPDYSLGFSTKAKQGGYDFYGTKAKYENKIVLSGNGLEGAGTINFIESTSISKALIFLPDSTMGFADFDNRPVETGIEFPDMQGKDVFITYVPKDLILKVKTKINQEIDMFNKQCRLKGTAYIQPFGATANGVTTFTDANLGSKKLRFKRWEIDSDTANFNVKNKFIVDDEDPLSLRTENLKAHVSFLKRKGEFQSNSGTSKVMFPVNQYMCKIDFFTWFMDREELELSTKQSADINIETDLDLAGSNFFSLHPEQDSLQFMAREAKYTMRNKTIYCKKVEYVEVGDARIYPDSSSLIIRKKAYMEPLKNSKIIANSVTKFHRFINCNTEIKGRFEYESKGDYPYYDRDSNMTLIKINKIWLDSTVQTVAHGKIGGNQDFKLSEQFNYFGDVAIKSALPLVKFSGSIRINHSCDAFKRSFMAITSDIDPKNIQIPIKGKILNADSNELFVGIAWRDAKDPDDMKMYPVFLSEIKDKNDKFVFSADGFLQYNPNTTEFQISTKEKLINRSEKGNYLALNTTTCSMNGLGVINLGFDLDPVKVDAVGAINYYQNTKKTTMNLTLKFQIPIEVQTWERLATKITENPDLKPMNFLATTYESALVEWTDLKTADKIKSDYTLMGTYAKIPDGARSALVVSGIRFSSFDDPKFDEKGIITTETESCIVSMYNKPVMKYLPMKSFIQQYYSGVSGDRFAMYFSVPGANDYYLDYYKQNEDGEMKIFSSDGDFLKETNDLKSDKRKSKYFTYLTTTNRVYLVKFLRLFGIEE